MAEARHLLSIQKTKIYELMRNRQLPTPLSPSACRHVSGRLRPGSSLWAQ